MALRVAIASGLPMDILKDVIPHDDTESQTLSIIYKMGFQAEKWVPTQLLNPSFKSVLYILILNKTVYVGESDRLVRRFQAHLQNKTVVKGYIVEMPNKSVARFLETKLQQELTFYNVSIESLNDMYHVE